MGFPGGGKGRARIASHSDPADLPKADLWKVSYHGHPWQKYGLIKNQPLVISTKCKLVANVDSDGSIHGSECTNAWNHQLQLFPVPSNQCHLLVGQRFALDSGHTRLLQYAIGPSWNRQDFLYPAILAIGYCEKLQLPVVARDFCPLVSQGLPPRWRVRPQRASLPPDMSGLVQRSDSSRVSVIAWQSLISKVSVMATSNHRTPVQPVTNRASKNCYLRHHWDTTNWLQLAQHSVVRGVTLMTAASYAIKLSITMLSSFSWSAKALNPPFLRSPTVAHTAVDLSFCFSKNSSLRQVAELQQGLDVRPKWQMTTKQIGNQLTCGTIPIPPLHHYIKDIISIPFYSHDPPRSTCRSLTLNQPVTASSDSSPCCKLWRLGVSLARWSQVM